MRESLILSRLESPDICPRNRYDFLHFSRANYKILTYSLASVSILRKYCLASLHFLLRHYDYYGITIITVLRILPRFSLYSSTSLFSSLFLYVSPLTSGYVISRYLDLVSTRIFLTHSNLGFFPHIIF